MPAWFKKFMAGSVLAMLFAGTASANLLEYSFTDTNGESVTRQPADIYANPTGKMTFALSAGLDRRVRISILDAAGKTVSTATSHMLGGSDRITVAGKEYYGAFLELSTPKEGDYTLKADIISASGEVVNEDTRSMVVDITPPSFGQLAQTNNVSTSFLWNTKVSPWRGAKVGGSSNIITLPVEDAIGIDRVTVSSFSETGEIVVKNLDARYNRNTGIAGYNGIDNSLFTRAGINLYTMVWTATDLSGNQAQISQEVAYSTVAGPSEPWAIERKGSSNVMAGQVGFEPYKTGMTVYSNPIEGIWRVSKSQWSEYARFGLGISTGSGSTKIHEDDLWVYVSSKGVIGSSTTFGDWTCTHRGSCGRRSVNVAIAEGVPSAPDRPTAQYMYSDIGWGAPGRRIESTALPLTISAARVTVTPRAQTQLVTTSVGNCEVAPGGTYCDIPWNLEIKPGTAGYMHSCCAVQGVDPTFKEPIPAAVKGVSGVRVRIKDVPELITDPVYWTGFWNDFWVPELKNWEIDGDTLRADIYMPANNGFQQKIGIRSPVLSVGSVNPRGTLALSTNSGMNTVYEYSLAGLGEGTHPITMKLENNTGSINNYDLGTITFDRTPPQVAIKALVEGDISTLDQFEVTVSDNNDPKPRLTSIRLQGGPASENVQLSSRELTPGVYALEYPIMFPSLEEGETYTITISAEDAHGNIGTDTINFIYSPLIVQVGDDADGKINIPAAPHAFKRRDGTEVFNSGAIALADGSAVSGTYDIFATLRIDAPGPLNIDGFVVPPGGTVDLDPVDFNATNGRIILPIHPVNQGAEGEYSIIISSSAPNSPMLLANIYAWAPKAVISKKDDNPSQVLSQQRIAVNQGGGSFCPITTSVQQARASDPILSPVCLLEWDQIPRGLKEVPVTGGPMPMTALEGRYLLDGEQKAVFNIYLYHADGTRSLIHQGVDTTEVLAVEHSASFIHSLEGATATRAIESIDLTLLQTGVAPECKMTTDSAEALSAATVGGPLTCLIEFKDVPSDLRQTQVSPPKYVGTMQSVGEHPVSWVASIFDEEGNKLTMEEKTSSITVVHPPVTSSLSFSVNESASIDVTSSETHPKAWMDKTYSVITPPGHGTVETTIRSFVYTPNPGYVGPDSFTYRVTDTSGMYAEAVADVSVLKYNYPPTVQPMSITAARNEVSSHTLTAYDPNLWDEITFETVKTATPAGIKASVVDGKLQIEPVEHWYGTAELTYRARDMEGLRSEPATITVNIPLGQDALEPVITFDDPSSCLAPGAVKGFAFKLEDFDSGINQESVKVQARFNDVTLDVPVTLTNSSQVQKDLALEVAPRQFVVSPNIQAGSELDERMRAAFLEIESKGGRAPFDFVVSGTDVAGNSASAAFTFDPSQIDDSKAPSISLSVGKDGSLMRHISDLELVVVDDLAGIHYEEVLVNLSYDGESIPIVFSQAYKQSGPSTNTCYSRHPLRLELRSHQSSMLDPDALAMLSRAYIAGDELTLSVTASDYAGNEAVKDFNFSFSPDIYRAEEVSVPAVKYQYRGAKGGPTASLPAEKLVWTHSPSVNYIAVASMEGGVPVALNGEPLSRGLPITLPAVALMEGDALSIDIRSDETGNGGKAEIMLIPLDSSARTVVVPVHVWAPEVKLSEKNKNPVQLFDEVVVTATQTDSRACRLSSVVDRAADSDKVADPVCLLRWDVLPAGTYSLPMDPPEVGGRIPEPGEHMLAWSVSFFDEDGGMHLMNQGEAIVNVRPASEVLRFEIDNNLDEVYRVISDVFGQLRQKAGPNCSVLTRSEQLAYDLSARNAPACLIDWEHLPNGITLDDWTDELKYSGNFEILEGDALFEYTVSSFTPTGERVEVGTFEEVIALADPPAPAIDMATNKLVTEDLYQVPLTGGLVGDFTVEALNAPVKIAIKEGGVEIDSDEASGGYSQRQTYRGRVLSGEKPLWTRTSVEIDARYTDLPEVSAQKNFEVLAVPDEDLRPGINLVDGTVLDIDGMTVDTWIGYPYRDDPYDKEKMGEWEIRLLNYLSTSKQDTLTDFVRVDGEGKVTFDIDLMDLGTNFIRVMPEARLVSPLPEYERTTMGSRPLHVSILRGEAIDSAIHARRVRGEAPLRFMSKLDLENRLDYKALGDVIWELRTAGASEWEEVDSGSTISDRFKHEFESGKYELRARVYNKNSEAEFVTELIEIHAYNVPKINIEGPSNAFIGSGAKLKLSATVNNELVDEKDLVVEWSEDNGDTWVSGGAEYVVKRDEEERLMMMTRVRMAEAPEDWQDANVTRRHRVAFRPVGPPRGSILGSRVIEEGKPVEWRGSSRAPYPRMDVEIEGYFILPDGTVVEEGEVEYLPTRADTERDRSEVQYVSWIVGYEDQGAKSTVSRRISVWQYEWPDWATNVRFSATQAPAEVSLRVRKPIGMGRYLEEVKYEWELPEGVELLPTRTEESRSLVINEPGVYPVIIRITDGRGHFTELVEELHISPADDWDVDFRMSASNADNRAPLAVRLSPSVRGGHPRDRVDVYRYMLNGETISEGVRYSSVELEAGTHELALEITSDYGETSIHSKVIEVKENTPPVCEMEARESRSHWRFFAHCTDETGRVRRHIWKVNGEQLTLSGSRISVSAREGGVVEVQMYAVDDGGAESNVVTWHGSIEATD